MNCANHPAEAAVAQCTECGKGLCVQCVQNQPKPVCAACHEKLRSQTVGSIVFHLLVYVGLFILGYKLNFMEGNGFPDGRFASGYTLMAVVSGWQFLNSGVGWRLVQGDLTAWAIYYVLKLLLSVIVGLILWDAFDKAFQHIFKEESICRIHAEKLLKCLIICLGEKSPVGVR